MAQVNYEVFHEKDQQWQKNYTELVQKYNALVERCASIPTPPKPLFCTTTNLGHGDSMNRFDSSHFRSGCRSAISGSRRRRILHFERKLLRRSRRFLRVLSG